MACVHTRGRATPCFPLCLRQSRRALVTHMTALRVPHMYVAPARGGVSRFDTNVYTRVAVLWCLCTYPHPRLSASCLQPLARQTQPADKGNEPMSDSHSAADVRPVPPEWPEATTDFWVGSRYHGGAGYVGGGWVGEWVRKLWSVERTVRSARSGAHKVSLRAWRKAARR